MLRRRCACGAREWWEPLIASAGIPPFPPGTGDARSEWTLGTPTAGDMWDTFPALLVPARPVMPPRSFIFLPSPESGDWELDEEAPRCIPGPPPPPTPTGDAEELFIAAAPSADDDADAIMDERCLTSMGGSLARND